MLTTTEHEKIRTLADTLIKELAGVGDKTKEKVDYFIECITLREHRTNQQSFFRAVIIGIMKEYSNRENGQFDGRNQNTVEFCKAIKKQIEDVWLPYI